MANSDFWGSRKVCVTGGAGFLGKVVVRKLQERGAGEIFVPTLDRYDLTKLDSINRLLDDAKPNLIIHLAAQVGGIGANREHPAEFFYNNLMMGVQLLHRAWETGVEKFVAIGTICAYPKYTPVPFKEENLWDGYPKRPTRLMDWQRKCSWSNRNRTVNSMATIRSSCCRSTFTALGTISIRNPRMSSRP